MTGPSYRQLQRAHATLRAAQRGPGPLARLLLGRAARKTVRRVLR